MSSTQSGSLGKSPKLHPLRKFCSPLSFKDTLNNAVMQLFSISDWNLPYWAYLSTNLYIRAEALSSSFNCSYKLTVSILVQSWYVEWESGIPPHAACLQVLLILGVPDVLFSPFVGFLLGCLPVWFGVSDRTQFMMAVPNI